MNYNVILEEKNRQMWSTDLRSLQQFHWSYLLLFLLVSSYNGSQKLCCMTVLTLKMAKWN